MFLFIDIEKTGNEIKDVFGYYGSSFEEIRFAYNHGNKNFELNVPNVRDLKKILVNIDATVDPFVNTDLYCDCNKVFTYLHDATSTNKLEYVYLFPNEVRFDEFGSFGVEMDQIKELDHAPNVLKFDLSIESSEHIKVIVENDTSVVVTWAAGWGDGAYNEDYVSRGNQQQSPTFSIPLKILNEILLGFFVNIGMPFAYPGGIPSPREYDIQYKVYADSILVSTHVLHQSDPTEWSLIYRTDHYDVGKPELQVEIDDAYDIGFIPRRIKIIVEKYIVPKKNLIVEFYPNDTGLMILDRLQRPTELWFDDYSWTYTILQDVSEDYKTEIEYDDTFDLTHFMLQVPTSNNSFKLSVFINDTLAIDDIYPASYSRPDIDVRYELQYETKASARIALWAKGDGSFASEHTPCPIAEKFVIIAEKIV